MNDPLIESAKDIERLTRDLAIARGNERATHEASKRIAVDLVTAERDRDEARAVAVELWDMVACYAVGQRRLAVMDKHRATIEGWKK